MEDIELYSGFQVYPDRGLCSDSMTLIGVLPPSLCVLGEKYNQYLPIWGLGCALNGGLHIDWIKAR